MTGAHYARCFAGIAVREALRFVQQRERFVAALEARGGKRGVASLCIGGGEATAMAVELL